MGRVRGLGLGGVLLLVLPLVRPLVVRRAGEPEARQRRLAHASAVAVLVRVRVRR